MIAPCKRRPHVLCGRKKVWMIGIVLIFCSTLKADVTAILPFEANGIDETEIGSVLADFAQHAFVKFHPQHTVIDRQRISKVLAEQSMQLTGISETAVQTGRILGANRILFGNLTKLGGKFTLMLNYVDAETGEIIVSKRESAAIPIEEVDKVLIYPMVEGMFTAVQKTTKVAIVIKQCIGIPGKDLLDKSDPYVEVTVGEKVLGRTRTYSNSSNPIYNDRFEISEYNDEPIVLRVYDEDLGGAEFIGGVVIKADRPETPKTEKTTASTKKEFKSTGSNAGDVILAILEGVNQGLDDAARKQKERNAKYLLANDPFKNLRGSGQYQLLVKMNGQTYSTGYIEVEFE